jgi:hypothetical protein
MRSLLLYLDARFGEPSTYAGLAALLAAGHVSLDPGVLHAVTLWGVVISGVLAVVLSEAGKKPPATIAADVLNALMTGIKAMPETTATPATPTK